MSSGALPPTHTALSNGFRCLTLSGGTRLSATQPVRDKLIRMGCGPSPVSSAYPFPSLMLSTLRGTLGDVVSKRKPASASLNWNSSLPPGAMLPITATFLAHAYKSRLRGNGCQTPSRFFICTEKFRPSQLAYHHTTVSVPWFSRVSSRGTQASGAFLVSHDSHCAASSGATFVVPGLRVSLRPCVDVGADVRLASCALTSVQISTAKIQSATARFDTLVCFTSALYAESSESSTIVGVNRPFVELSQHKNTWLEKCHRHCILGLSQITGCEGAEALKLRPFKAPPTMSVSTGCKLVP